MKKLQFIITLLIIFLSLLGCADPKILERVSLVTLIGYDLEEKDKVSATVALRSVNQEFQSIVSITSQTESTSKGTRIKASLDSGKKVVAGQLRVVLLGDKVAEGGLNEALHTLAMNSEISSSIYLAVVNGDSKSLIDRKYENVTDIGQHIFFLIDHNVEEEFILSSTLHEVIRDNYSPFSDMALPMIEQDENDVKISGIALFNEDKLVGKLAIEDSFYVVLIRDKFNAGNMQLTISGNAFKKSSKDTPDELSIALDSIHSNRTTRLINEVNPEFNLDIKVEARLLEIHSSINTEDPQIIKTLEKELNKKVEKEISRIIKHTQELNSDMFGFGEIYRSSVGNKVEDKIWKKLYPKVKVNVNIDIKLVTNGIFK